MSLGRLRYFFTTLRELTPDGGVSIRTSRTSRQLMNVFYGNHRNDNIICFCGNHLNLFDALIMASVFTDNVALSRFLLVFHFIGDSFLKVNNFVRVARRYCLGIVEDDKEEGQVAVEQFRSKAESLMLFAEGNGCSPDLMRTWTLLSQAWNDVKTAEKRSRQMDFIVNTLERKTASWFYFDISYANSCYSTANRRNENSMVGTLTLNFYVS